MTVAKGNTHSRSVALSVFMNSCLARRRMSGSNLRTDHQSCVWLQAQSHAFVYQLPTSFPFLSYSLNILADLSLKAMASLLQLFDGAILRKFIGSTAHLTLCQAAREQLLHIDTHTVNNMKATSRSKLNDTLSG